MNGASALLEALEQWGVRRVFCCPGTTETPVLAALAVSGDAQRNRFVLATHEAIAVSMADGYARAGGGYAAVYLHTNVGLANGLAHLSAAHLAGTPMAVLVGIKPTQTLPHRALTTTPNLREIARPWCKSDWQVLRPDALVDDLRRTFQVAASPPSGPALLVIPQDILAAELGECAVPPLPPTPRAVADSACVQRAAAVLLAARRPLLVAGAAMATSEGIELLRRLARLLDSAVLAESRRDLERTAYPTTCPYYGGNLDAGAEPLVKADVVLVAGSPTYLEFEPDRGPLLPPEAALIHLCSDADEIGRRFPTVCGLLGNPVRSLEALVEAVSSQRGTGDPDVLDDRRAYLVAVLARQHERKRAAADSQAELDIALRAICSTAGDQDVFVVDAVTGTEPLLSHLERTDPAGFHATSSGSLGWGMGAALGVALAHRDRDDQRRVVAVVGDGVAQFGLPALFSARQLQLPVTFVVLNNRGYRAVRSHVRRNAGPAVARARVPLADVDGVDFAAVAHGFGLRADRVDARSPQLRDLLTSRDDGPQLIEIMVSND